MPPVVIREQPIYIISLVPVFAQLPEDDELPRLCTVNEHTAAFTGGSLSTSFAPATWCIYSHCRVAEKETIEQGVADTDMNPSGHAVNCVKYVVTGYQP